jgi:hypothetical protein
MPSKIAPKPDTIREFLRRLGHPVAIVCRKPIGDAGSIVLWPSDLDVPDIAARRLAPDFDAIFCNLNPLKSPYRQDVQPPGTSIRRDMITRIARVLIDLDSQGSTKAEAYRQMLAIRDELGEPIMATDSGNGHALIYAVDLPVESFPRVVAFLKNLKERYSCVDASVGTPERLTRLIGTFNRDKLTGERIQTCLLT